MTASWKRFWLMTLEKKNHKQVFSNTFRVLNNKVIVDGPAGLAMAGPLFWPKMVSAGPQFWIIRPKMC